MPRELFLRAGAFFHEDLDESARFRVFPRQRLFARGQLYDHIADPA